MGNSLGGKRSIAKVMKINGETIKFKTPIQAGEITKDYPGHVLLESETVKELGIHAKPLDTWQELKRNRLYFIVELPPNNIINNKDVVQQQQAGRPRRVRSGINMTAKDRLESLKLYRRSVSNITIVPKQISDHDLSDANNNDNSDGSGTTGVRVKMRLPKAEVERLIRECKDEAEAAEKIIGLCMGAAGTGGGHGCGGADYVNTVPPRRPRHVQWNPVVQV